jgi:hypothetical protein
MSLERLDVGAARCDECDCPESATVALNLHRRATNFAGQHYAIRQFYCDSHALELARALAAPKAAGTGVCPLREGGMAHVIPQGRVRCVLCFPELMAGDLRRSPPPDGGQSSALHGEAVAACHGVELSAASDV